MDLLKKTLQPLVEIANAYDSLDISEDTPHGVSHDDREIVSITVGLCRRVRGYLLGSSGRLKNGQAKKLTGVAGRFITKVTRDELTGALLFHDARKNVMFMVNPDFIYDERGMKFEDDI